jgi:hypothetical protein
MLLLACFAQGLGFAQQPPLPSAKSIEVDQAEVMRMGDLVQVTADGEFQSSATAAFVEAMGPPKDDAGKWFVTVLTTKDCSACDQLKRDWASSPWLQALAKPGDPAGSWAHYSVYDKNDPTQAFRWKAIKVTSFPTIIVQPPRSGIYGSPATVVYQDVYRGDPKLQAQSITTAIRRYIGTLPNVSTLSGSKGATADSGFRQGQITPPWNNEDLTAPWNNDRPLLPRLPDPVIPPLTDLIKPSLGLGWGSLVTILAGAFLSPSMWALGTASAAVLREIKLRTPPPPPGADPQQIEKLVSDLFQRLSSGTEEENATATKTRKPRGS